MGVKMTYTVHGATIENEQGLATGWNDSSLTELGVVQAKELRDLRKDIPFAAVFTSDLKRATETAAIAFSGFEHIQDERLREANYGDLNGGPHSFKENMEDYVEAAFPNGESYVQVEERIQSFVEMLKTHYDGKEVAVVAHQAPQLALDVIVMGMTWPEAIANDWRKTKAWKPGWVYEF